MRSDSAKFFALRASRRVAISVFDLCPCRPSACFPARREPKRAQDSSRARHRLALAVSRAIRRSLSAYSGRPQRVEHGRREIRSLPFSKSPSPSASASVVEAFLKPLHGPVDRLAVMRAQHVEAQHLARPVVKQIPDRHEIAERSSPSSRLRPAGIRYASRYSPSRRNGTRSAFARFRSRDAERRDRCRRHGCRTSRRDASSTSPSIRYASRDGPAS